MLRHVSGDLYQIGEALAAMMVGMKRCARLCVVK